MSSQAMYGASILSDMPQAILDKIISDPPPEFLDIINSLFINIGTRGLSVDRVDIFRSGGTKIRIEAFPRKLSLADYTHIIREAHLCPECCSFYETSGSHPNVLCKIGIAEDVLYL